MKKIFQVLSVVLVLSSLVFPQKVIDSLIVSDLQGTPRTLYFGLDSLATDGIDVIFGESMVPPFPPPGAFEARFFLPQDNFSGIIGSYRDYRNAPSFPFSGQKEFRLAYQRGFGTVVKFEWNLPQNVTGVLQDILTGTIVNVPMSGVGSYTVTNPDALNRLKMLIDYDEIIPVELTSFTATVVGTAVNLNWSTATEKNNRGFEIERRSDNSSDWQKIGFVEGAGTATIQKDYSFTDKPSEVGKYYYRLRQIDFDGTFEYSKVVEAEIASPTEFKLNQNYPNPFNPSTTISFSLPKATDAKLTIYNQIGQKVAELVNKNLEAGNYSFNWNASNQSSGLYFYELQTNEFKSVKKMTLIK
ncbi:MAG TPA: T9SS type A sorting domain-containing protein [Ignavibacteriaceae bacterium]|jgi:hypothetical protein|nr:MAG: hypothetical protein B6D44_16730 [Ignavibacteriales bacterium UTCHB2]HQF43300.1 T9SS type A sorting domain-containing protein [Ignavibacteriaceae bacterium]HQI42195.1 T9SS type A sorting domain-containing protein [Ignavibacteriaceae bacterium]